MPIQWFPGHMTLARPLRAVRGHVSHCAVAAGGQPVEQPRLRRAEVDARETDGVEAQFQPPAADFLFQGDPVTHADDDTRRDPGK